LKIYNPIVLGRINSKSQMVLGRLNSPASWTDMRLGRLTPSQNQT